MTREVRWLPAVYFEKTKTDAPRYVYLADEGFAFFEALVSGKKPDDLLLLKKDGEPWGRNHHYRVMKEACEEAKIEPLGFHQLRHTYASLYLMSGGSLVALAKQLGHTTTRMVEKHYGHLAESWLGALRHRRDGFRPKYAIRSALPSVHPKAGDRVSFEPKAKTTSWMEGAAEGRV